MVKWEHGVYRLKESRERGTQGDTQAGRTAQEIGEKACCVLAGTPQG